MKKFLLPIALVVVIIGIVVYFLVSKGGKSTVLPQQAGQRQIINALPFADRPFVALVPHTTNKLLTLYFDKPGNGKSITVDIDYLSGTSLKGGRTSVADGATLPYTTAFLLGSCSTGGKCSFDKDITTGTLKTSLQVGSELHILKSNYTFVGADESATTDQKLSFKSSTKLATPLIASQTHGYIGTLTDIVANEPVAITSTSDKKITGALTVYAPDAEKLLIYDGTDYKPLTATKVDNRFTVNINQAPWSKTVTITRDDEKGTAEQVTLYLLGPIVPIK